MSKPRQTTTKPNAKSIKPKTGSRKKEQVRNANGTYSTRLTRKQKAFADELLNDKKKSATEAAMQTYNTTDRNTAGVIAAQNLRNTNIQLYIDEHVDRAKETVVNLLDSDKDEIKLRSAQDILDRTHGKATQTVQTTGVHIQMNISNDDLKDI